MIPREWTYSIQTVGPAVASIVIPAANSNLSHVLTHAEATYLDYDGTIAQAQLRVLDGALILYSKNMGTSPLLPLGEPSRDDVSADGNWESGPGVAMTITLLAIGANANYQQFLLVRGYDF